MASGDVTSPAISANGTEITFTVDSLTGASVTTSVGDEIGTIDCTDEINGTTSTGSRTGIRVFYRSASGTTVTGYLEEPIHDDTTAVTLDMDAGAVTDGSVSSNAVSEASVTNNSTLDYPEAVCLMVSPRISYTQGEGFYVDVVAGGRVYNGHEGELGLAKVSVTVTDNWGGSGTAVTKEATSLTTVDRAGSNGAYEKEVLFRVGPFDPTNGGDWTTAATTGLASITASAYPKIGDADSVTTDPHTHYIYLDPAAAYEFRHAVVDPTNGDDATGRVATGDGGYYAGTDSVDATAAANRYADLHTAISEMQRGDGTTAAPAHGTASWCVAYIVEDDHLLGTETYGERSDTSLGPVIVTRLPSATKANAKITGSADNDGLRTAILKLDDLTVQFDATSSLRTGAPQAGTTGPAGTDNWLMFDKVDVIGPGRTASMAAVPFTSFEYIEARDSSVSACRNMTTFERHRSCTFSDIANDINQVIAGSSVLQFNTLGDQIDSTGTGSHADTLQIREGQTNTDAAQWQCLFRNLTGVQAPIFCNGSGATPTLLSRFLQFGTISEPNAGAEKAQIDDLQMSSCYFYASSWLDELALSDNDLETTMPNCLFRGVFNDSITESFGIDVNITASYWVDCYQSTLGTLGTDGIRIGGGNGTAASTLFVDTDTTYQPATGEALAGAIATRFVTYAADGAPVPPTNAAIGALQGATAAPSPGLAPAGATGAYAYAGERFVYIVFDAGITYTEPGGFFIYPVTVSKPGGTPEAVNSLEVVGGNTLKIGFTGDTPAIGDSDWTVSISNGSGYITTTSNGAPIANQTDLAVGVTSSDVLRLRARTADERGAVTKGAR